MSRLVTATDKQRLLARSLYRSLFRWCKSAPDNAYLGHLGHWVNGIHIDNPQTLQEVLRQTFRHGNGKYDDMKSSLQEALDGMRLLYGINFDDLPKIESSDPSSQSIQSSSESSHQEQQLQPYDLFKAVEWLPPMSESEDTLVENTHLPLFPLSGPLLPNDKDDLANLPLFSHLPDVPVEGMEIPLRIFEPRYRQLYQDVLSNGTKRFVVPFSHPYLPGQFATMAWLYEIVRVEDVADQTNGQVALMCHHLVTRPVKIRRIINPADWKTRFTYLRVEAEIQSEFISWEMDDLKEIDQLLRTIKQSQPQKAHLMDKMLTALAENNLWSLVNVWITHLQMTVLGLRVEIAGKIQDRHKVTGVTTESTIRDAQQPYQTEMESLLLEISTLVPLLLQKSSSPKEQCKLMYQRIQHRMQPESQKYAQPSDTSRLFSTP